MTEITDELVIRGNHIKNRIVMPPMVTFSFHGDNGSYYGKQHIEHYTKRAKGGAGLIIVQATSVFGAIDSTGMWSAGDISALKQIASNCHEYGATVMMQLHCGNMDINELSTEEIHSMQKNMKRAAIRACEIGFDGVEFNFAHGFTLCKFLDASYNRRTDKYGGDVLYRARVLTQILPEIRNNTPKNFIVSVRMGEHLPESKDGVEAAKAFEKAGIDLLHISFGMQPPTNPVPDGFICSPITYSGCKIKKEVKIPVIAVNEIRNEEQVRFLIENDYVDLVAVGRGMLTDPEFANHVINSEPVNTCLGCERCFWFTDHTSCPAESNK
ncbi:MULTISPECIES: NADH:flavin oxidoreductase [Methanosarcina]|uniref:NADH oxidase n=3 Tax=Methanosarcina barkeri TaxID=2208 RepID=A0A0E3LN52_METBA|nr:MULTISPECIES: NADH:flavin oxidoreductase [Methanosarcina]AKB54166.1 NADH oxidase [Methanosarcina barkeri MS]AKB57759.1 NADH oxidase [Methanosarcina barkeri 227]AKJ38300.1 NADH dependent flavin oxidoreductase [Methanosarcina barkeri CM1]OED11244.1 NADH-dependent flavin oxidoreductase [Methanosarcina sp. A14]